ncbi:MAG: GrdX family protein [Defluviitaleaceae bacterium]|nr:GrdX family protein [Defluviitaleaceae bacterium]
MDRYIIVTNNPLTAQNAGSGNILCYSADALALDILREVRGMVHEGYKLATHPLTSSLKPNETPYKSVLLYAQKEAICYESLELAESAVIVSEKFANQRPPTPRSAFSQKVLDDFAAIDYDMVRQWV